MSSTVETGTPTRPTSPQARSSSESRPSCVGRSKATLRPVVPRSSRRRYRALLSSTEENPAYWRIVHGSHARFASGVHDQGDATRASQPALCGGLQSVYLRLFLDELCQNPTARI